MRQAITLPTVQAASFLSKAALAVTVFLPALAFAEPAQPAAAAASANASTPANAAPADKPVVKFDIQEYRVLGNTVLEPVEIERLLYPLLGPDKQLSDVEAARVALEKAYHAHGYGTVFVDIPPQDVEEGIVRLHVTEARVHERKIDGGQYFSERDIAKEIPSGKSGSVPNLTDLQKQVADVNSVTADRSVVPILKAGPEPGTLDMELKVQDRLPLHGSLELNDDYTVDTHALRAIAGLSYGNLFAALDQIALQYQTSPQDFSQVKVENVGYTSRPFLDGYRVALSFLNSNSDVANVGGSTGVLGKGQIWGLRLSTPTFGPSNGSEILTLGVDYKHFKDVVTVGGGSADLITPISYTSLSLSYSGFWRWSLLDESLTLSPNFGLRYAPNNPDNFENKRYLGRPNFAFLRWDDTLGFNLPWRFRLTLRLAGQLTNEPLISNENFSIGGSDGVRGYLEAEELGDNAIKGTLQLQTPTWNRVVPKLFNAFAFIEAGHTHSFATLGGQPEHAELRSWGVGLNLMPSGPVTGSVSWAEPMRDGTYTRADQGRVLFTVRGAF